MLVLRKIWKQSISIISVFIIFSHLTTYANVVEDAAITAEVKVNLLAEKDIPKSIDVTTKNGVVILKGNVDTTLQAHKIIEIASSAEGVFDVIDTQLRVKESKSFIADAKITAKVKGKIRRLFVTRKIANGYELHVETTNQVVHIFGKVTRPADVDTVTTEVKGVAGVKSLKTNITVND